MQCPWLERLDLSCSFQNTSHNGRDYDTPGEYLCDEIEKVLTATASGRVRPALRHLLLGKGAIGDAGACDGIIAICHYDVLACALPANPAPRLPAIFGVQVLLPDCCLLTPRPAVPQTHWQERKRSDGLCGRRPASFRHWLCSTRRASPMSEVRVHVVSPSCATTRCRYSWILVAPVQLSTGDADA